MELLSRAEQEMSLAALKQHDPYITSIADLTGQVALYTFCPKANQWVSEARPGTRPDWPLPPLKGTAQTAEDWGWGREAGAQDRKGEAGTSPKAGSGAKEVTGARGIGGM